MESIINSIINIFGNVTSLKYGRELIVFIISILPVLELRGGLLAASLLKLPLINGYIASMIGNILPVPFILLFINKILELMENSKIKFIRKFARWLDKKAIKNKDSIEKYGYWGLVLFVGIPLPGTGAWTGCLVSQILNMDRKKSFLACMLGIFLASIIMLIISYGLVSNLIN